MKPSWNDAPEWAQYLAMDSDGVWCWYRSKPTPDDHFCIWFSTDCRYEHVDSDWQDSLESRPELGASV